MLQNILIGTYLGILTEKWLINFGGLFMLQSIGVPGFVIILVIALILFGPSKLPQLGRAVGQTLKEFKDSTKDIVDDITGEFKEVKEEFKLSDSNKEDTAKK